MVKGNFIQKHGQELWNLAMAYSKGDRSQEAIDAWRLYNRETQGRSENTFTIYGIYDKDDNLLYVGSTGCRLGVRWSEHKNDAKRRHSRPFYAHMNDVVKAYGGSIDDHFHIESFECVDDPQTARKLEQGYIDNLHPVFNIRKATTHASKIKEIRPLSIGGEVLMRDANPDLFGFAVAKRS